MYKLISCSWFQAPAISWKIVANPLSLPGERASIENDEIFAVLL
jgi:hypothetical protein